MRIVNMRTYVIIYILSKFVDNSITLITHLVMYCTVTFHKSTHSFGYALSFNYAFEAKKTAVYIGVHRN